MASTILAVVYVVIGIYVGRILGGLTMYSEGYYDPLRAEDKAWGAIAFLVGGALWPVAALIYSWSRWGERIVKTPRHVVEERRDAEKERLRKVVAERERDLQLGPHRGDI